MNDPHDNGIRKRLARLADTPLDTSGLEERLDEMLSHAEQSAAPRTVMRLWPALAMAAMLLVVASVTLVVFVNLQDSAMPASPALLSQIYDEVLAGDPNAVAVSDLAEARRAISARWPDAPLLPEFAADRVESCCVHHVKERRMVCVVGRVDGTPVTMVVAHSADVRPDRDTGTEREGFCCHAHGDQNMVCKVVGDRTICLVGELPSERLIQMAVASKW